MQSGGADLTPADTVFSAAGLFLRSQVLILFRHDVSEGQGMSDCHQAHNSGNRVEHIIKEKNMEAGKTGGLCSSPGQGQWGHMDRDVGVELNS